MLLSYSCAIIKVAAVTGDGSIYTSGIMLLISKLNILLAMVNDALNTKFDRNGTT